MDKELTAICGDAIEELKKIPSKSVQLIVTDPPYNLNKDYGNNKDKFLSVTPGLTGYWAANGRSMTTYPQRMTMELYYVDNISWKLDLKIILKTVVSVVKKEGAV